MTLLNNFATQNFRRAEFNRVNMIFSTRSTYGLRAMINLAA